MGAALSFVADDGMAVPGVFIPVSVNINSLHLRQLDFVERLGATLSMYPSISNGQIELEIVETSSLENLEIVSRRSMPVANWALLVRWMMLGRAIRHCPTCSVRPGAPFG